MSTIKVDKLQGTSGSATGLTFSGANGTFGGTLAVTGVHTVGTNAVATSENGASTTSVVQGLAKFWIQHNDGASTADSFNAASTTDNGTGDYSHAFTNNMRAASNYANSGLALAINDKASFINGLSGDVEFAAASFRYQTGFVANTGGAQTNHDCNATSPIIHGDLA